MKREGVMRKKSNNWRRVFQIALQGREGLGILLGEILTIQCLRHAADNPQINKISMIYWYRKPEVKKKKWCNSNDYSYNWSLYCVITWKLLFGEVDFSGAGNEHFILLLGGILPPSTGFPPNGWFGGRGRAIHTW